MPILYISGPYSRGLDRPVLGSDFIESIGNVGPAEGLSRAFNELLRKFKPFARLGIGLEAAHHERAAAWHVIAPALTGTRLPSVIGNDTLPASNFIGFKAHPLVSR